MLAVQITVKEVAMPVDAIATFFLDLLKERMGKVPEYVNINLVRHSDSRRDLFRIINIGPITITLMDVEISITGEAEPFRLPALYHPSITNDPMVNECIHNEIPFPESSECIRDGIAIYPGGMYYFPLSALSVSIPASARLQAMLRFKTLEGRISEPFTKNVIVVRAFRNADAVLDHLSGSDKNDEVNA